MRSSSAPSIVATTRKSPEYISSALAIGNCGVPLRSQGKSRNLIVTSYSSDPPSVSCNCTTTTSADSFRNVTLPRPLTTTSSGSAKLTSAGRNRPVDSFLSFGCCCGFQERLLIVTPFGQSQSWWIQSRPSRDTRSSSRPSMTALIVKVGGPDSAVSPVGVSFDSLSFSSGLAQAPGSPAQSTNKAVIGAQSGQRNPTCRVHAVCRHPCWATKKAKHAPKKRQRS